MLRRAPLVLLLAAPLALWPAGCACTVGSQQGYAPAQPIAFSHALHSGQYQMDCQYCHFAASRSRHAGVPPAEVCLNCHSQVKKDSPEIQKIAAAVAAGRPIEWVKVHRLPDHAFFSHQDHVAANVTCQSCHGPVETMVRVEQVAPMTMGWCLECHRARGAGPVRASGDQVPTTDCSGCHR